MSAIDAAPGAANDPEASAEIHPVRRGLTRAVAGLAGIGATLRGARLFHPRGAVFHGTFTVLGGEHGAPLLDRPAEHPALVRLSKAGSTPADWPDVLGLAIRVYCQAGPLDLALATTGGAVGLRHLLVPRRDFAGAMFTSLLPYRVGDEQRMIAATPTGARAGVGADLAALRAAVAERPLTFTVMLAEVRGPWRPVAELSVREPTDADPSFDVDANTVEGIRPAGWLNALRGPAYRASQRGRRAG